MQWKNTRTIYIIQIETVQARFTTWSYEKHFMVLESSLTENFQN